MPQPPVDGGGWHTRSRFVWEPDEKLELVKLGDVPVKDIDAALKWRAASPTRRNTCTTPPAGETAPADNDQPEPR